MDEPVGIQGRIGTLMDSIQDEFLREAIGELFTMEKLKSGAAEITCKACGDTRKYKVDVSSPDYKGIAYAVKTLLDAIGRTKEPAAPAPEVTQSQVDVMVKDALDRMLSGPISDEDLAKLAAS